MNTENIAIFEDTKRQYTTNTDLVRSINSSIAGQVFIPALATIRHNEYRKNGQVIVSSKRTFEAAEPYAKQGKKVAILNFASATTPGGGVTKGSPAQEECLCRASTLYPCLCDKDASIKFYAPHRMAMNALNNDDIIYTPNVTVFKTDDGKYTMMDRKDWYNVNVITCAAPNLRDNPSNPYNVMNGVAVEISENDLFQLHLKRISKIMESGIGNDVLILGAFGCGAFLNPPTLVMKAFAAALQKYRYYYNIIEFAVYCGKDTYNYNIFKQLK